MAGIICPECGGTIYRYNSNICHHCGKDLSKKFITIKSDVNIVEKIDTILTWSKKATKKQIEEGFNENERVNYYHNLSSGESSIKLSEVMREDGFRLIERKKKCCKGIYVEKDEKNGLVVFILGYIRTSMPEKGEVRNWEEIVRLYINKDKKILTSLVNYQNHSEFGWWEYQVLKDKYLEFDFRLQNVGFDITKYMYINEVDDSSWTNLFSEITDLIPEGNIVRMRGNQMMNINDLSSFVKYLKYKAPVIKKRGGPMQQKIDELTGVKLGPVKKPSILNKALDVNINSFLSKNVDTFAVLEKVPTKENTCVLRTFSCTEDNIMEGYRLYIEGKKVYNCKSNGTDFIYTPLYMNSRNWEFSLEDFNTDVVKGTILEYFGSVIESIPVELRGKAIWAFIKWPIFEQISKAGYINTVCWILENSCKKNPGEVLNSLFGEIQKGKNLLQRLGVNKWQMEYVEAHSTTMNRAFRTEYYESFNFGVISFIKNIVIEETLDIDYRKINFSNGSIADIDKETFFTYTDIFTTIFDKNNFPEYIPGKLNFLTREDTNDAWSYMYNTQSKVNKTMQILNKLRNVYSPATALNMTESLKDICDKYIIIRRESWGGHIYESKYDALTMYNDYLNTVKLLDDTKNFRASFKDVDSIKDMHDSAALIYNMKKDEINAKKFEERSKGWKKWTYDCGDYMVISPEKPEELAHEGFELHHCVKTYIKKVSEGVTNIVFIRKKDESNTPFFTAEISNEGYIEQIHGLCNRNLETEPDLVPFVKKWVKNCHLKERNFNKIR